MVIFSVYTNSRSKISVRILICISFLQFLLFISPAYSVKKSIPSKVVPESVSEVFSMVFFTSAVDPFNLRDLYRDLTRSGSIVFNNTKSTIYELNEAHLEMYFPAHKRDKKYLLKYSLEPNYRSAHLEEDSSDYQTALRTDLLRKRRILSRIPGHKFLMKVLAKEWRVQRDVLVQFELIEKVEVSPPLSAIEKSERLVEAIRALLAAGIIHGDLQEENFFEGVLIDFDVMYSIVDQEAQKSLVGVSPDAPYLARFLELTHEDRSKVHQTKLAFELKFILSRWLLSKRWVQSNHAVFLEVLLFGRLKPSPYYYTPDRPLPSLVHRKFSMRRIQRMRNAGVDHPISSAQVRGDGDCIFHSLMSLTGNRLINRREFVRRLLAKNRELIAMVEAGTPLTPQDQMIQSVIEGIILHSPQHISEQNSLEIWAEYFLSPFDLGEYPMADHPVVQAIAVIYELNIAMQQIEVSGDEPIFVPFQTCNANGETTPNPASPTYYIGYVSYDPSGGISTEGEPNHFIPISLGATPPSVVSPLPTLSAAPSVPSHRAIYSLGAVLPALVLGATSTRL